MTIFSRAHFRWREPKTLPLSEIKAEQQGFYRIMIISIAVSVIFIWVVSPDYYQALRLFAVLGIVIAAAAGFHFLHKYFRPLVEVTDTYIYRSFSSRFTELWKIKDIHDCQIDGINTETGKSYAVLIIESERGRSMIGINPSVPLDALKRFLTEKGVKVKQMLLCKAKR